MRGTCSIDGCERPHYGRSWCKQHYRRWRRTGKAGTTPIGRTPAQRFWSKVDRSGMWTCWNFTASRNKAGYGEFCADGRIQRAHRFAYELLVGPIPDGLQLDHLCRNTSCVNPLHLEPVTNRENTLRAKAFRTHCRHGHEYTPENTGISSVGNRYCVICKRWRERERYLARKAALRD